MGDRGNSLLRFFDRWVGIPIVWMAGLFVRKKPPPKMEDIRAVGVLAIAAIGDTVLISAVLKDMLAVLSGRPVTVFCSLGNRAAFELCIGEAINLVTIPVKNLPKAIKNNQTGAV